MPRTGSPHTHRGAAVAAVLLAAFAATSLARGVEEVVPGQKLFGEIEPAKDLTIVLRVVDGTQLSLSAKARKGSSLRPLFSLRDPDGGLVAIDEFVKGSKKGNAAKLKKLPIELGGAYQLTILGDFNSTGEFDLATSAKFPTKDKGVAEVVTADQVVAIEFDGLPGDVVQLKLGKAKKSDLSASILRYVEEGGTTTEIGEPKKSGKHTVGTTGRHRFEISGTDGTTGQFKYLLKIKRAKAPKDKRDLAELDASGTITGRIVLDGDVSRESVPGKRAARTAPSPTSIEGVRAGEIIVGTPAGVGPNEAHAFVAEEIPGVNFEVVRGMTDDGPYLIRVPDLAADPGSHATRRRTVELAAQLDASPVVRYAEVNRLVTATKHPSDVRWPEQYDMRQMNLPEAWDIETGSSAVVIAIVDTGIWPHPDLGAKVINGYDFVSSVGDAFDGNGWDSDPTDHARDFHGTHVAGTAAASTNNGSGVAGVAWGCRVLPVRVLGASGGTYFDIAAGLRWAVGLPVNGVPNNPSPADVVNMSLGGESPSSTMSQAVRDASATGAVLVAASGNNASNVPFYPASYPEVISIYALDSNLHWASYSNWGSTIDLGAPGGDLNAGLPGILSTYVDGSLNATYTQLQGTSMASPHIAGVVALMRSADPAISASEIRKVLIETAVDLGPAGFDEDYGHGMVDAFAALEKITPAPQAPPTLRINPSALKFGKLTDERRVYVRNAGSGEVTLNRIQSETESNGPWLSAVADTFTTPVVLTVTVDHERLGDGLFEGQVILETSVGQARIPVKVTRAKAPELNIVRIKAVNDAGQVVASTSTNKAKNWEYSLDDVPIGDFRIIAEADLDADLELTRVDEFEGAWPLLDRPQTLTVTIDDLDRGDVDVPLSRLDRRFDFDGVGGGIVDGAIGVRVTDAYTGVPIEGADVIVGDGDFVSVTDPNGRAVVSGEFSGGQDVTVAIDGYATQTRVDVDAQYQSFALVPRTPPTFKRVNATVSGLTGATDEIVVHVGRTRASEAWEGGASQAIEVDVPVTVPIAAISVVVYGADAKPFLFGLDSVLLTGDDELDVSLDMAPPPGGARGRVLDVSLPPHTFTALGAALDATIEVRLAANEWVPIGFDALTPDSSQTVWWASLIDLDPPLAMRFEIAATDLAGRVGRRVFIGDTASISVERPLTLPAPGQASSPSGGQVVDAVGVRLSYAPTENADYAQLDVFDDAGALVWRVLMETKRTSFELPDLSIGGLEPARSYTWRVETRELENFDYDRHLTDDLTGKSIIRTTSAPQAFGTR